MFVHGPTVYVRTTLSYGVRLGFWQNVAPSTRAIMFIPDKRGAITLVMVPPMSELLPPKSEEI